MKLRPFQRIRSPSGEIRLITAANDQEITTNSPNPHQNSPKTHELWTLRGWDVLLHDGWKTFKFHDAYDEHNVDRPRYDPNRA